MAEQSGLTQRFVLLALLVIVTGLIFSAIHTPTSMKEGNIGRLANEYFNEARSDGELKRSEAVYSSKLFQKAEKACENMYDVEILVERCIEKARVKQQEALSGR